MRLMHLATGLALAAIPASAMAYLSRDGTRLADGAGNCAVCEAGWSATGSGTYTCSETVTRTTNCHPAATAVRDRPRVTANRARPGAEYDTNGRVLRPAAGRN